MVVVQICVLHCGWLFLSFVVLHCGGFQKPQSVFGCTRDEGEDKGLCNLTV